MQASMAAAAGKPMLSDEEYDDLKAQLRNKNSRVVQQASLICTHENRQHALLHRISLPCIVLVLAVIPTIGWSCSAFLF